jgi:hypothetical protein
MSDKTYRKPKKRIPLPVKPPKVEPDPKAYNRQEKHKKDWAEGDDRGNGESRKSD